MLLPSVCVRGDGRLIFLGDLNVAHSAKHTEIRAPTTETGTKQATSRIDVFSVKEACIRSAKGVQRNSSNDVDCSRCSSRYKPIREIPAYVAIKHDSVIDHNIASKPALGIVSALADNE